MKRRDFLKAIGAAPAVAVLPALAAAPASADPLTSELVERYRLEFLERLINPPIVIIPLRWHVELLEAGVLPREEGVKWVPMDKLPTYRGER